MYKIIGVIFLLVILVDNFSDSTASQAGFYVSKEHIRKCGCRAFPNGKISCRSTLFRGKHVEMQDLVKCFCSKTNRHKFPEFRAACTSWHPFLSTPL
ncbi:hypothetical protein D9C73_027375 [Xyrichtys novacula]|uniref:Uncharacterized protein n=1 Tax=Xyrichtys novacula TaxID=13765 RepID=A0AAV1HM22_XYRNO|nr:hypothetical protein D9C73_027375 [Xyrichtys novacula]